jgi:hypothetical protein
MQLELLRDTFLDACTLGTLSVAGLRFETIECPWMDGANLEGECAVLEGEYPVTTYMSPGQGYEVLLLHDVPGRAMIEIHIANYVINPITGIRELKGCIAPGTHRATESVENSRTAFLAIRTEVVRAIARGEKVTILIRNAMPDDSGSSARA